MPYDYGSKKKALPAAARAVAKAAKKKTPPGFHRMPDGSLMRGESHKGKK
jgi:hypothetical protein